MRRAAVNEVEEFQTLEDLPDAVTVEEFNEGVMRMDKDAEAHYTRWCVTSVEASCEGRILPDKIPRCHVQVLRESRDGCRC